MAFSGQHSGLTSNDLSPAGRGLGNPPRVQELSAEHLLAPKAEQEVTAVQREGTGREAGDQGFRSQHCLVSFCGAGNSPAPVHLGTGGQTGASIWGRKGGVKTSCTMAFSESEMLVKLLVPLPAQLLPVCLHGNREEILIYWGPGSRAYLGAGC